MIGSYIRLKKSALYVEAILEIITNGKTKREHLQLKSYCYTCSSGSLEIHFNGSYNLSVLRIALVSAP